MLRVIYIGDSGPSRPRVRYALRPLSRPQTAGPRAPTILRRAYNWDEIKPGQTFTVPYWPDRSAEYAQHRVAKAFCHWRARDPATRDQVCVKTRQTDAGIFVERVR